MKSLLLGSILACLLFLGAGAAQSASAKHRVVMRFVVKNPDVSPRPDGNIFLQPKIFEFAGKRVATVEDFKTAVLALRSGTELYWDSGCIKYDALPVAGPSATIVELQHFCAAHGVIFKHVYGY